MYLNLFELTGIPEFYSKGVSGNGEFYYMNNSLVYFSYPEGSSELNLPKNEDGTLKCITVKGFLHSEEQDGFITCYDCNTEFSKKITLTYLTVTSFMETTPVTTILDKPQPNSYGVVLGDVQSIREVEGRERSFYMARLAIKDTTAEVGFSYVSVSSLHPFTVEKGDRLLAKGRLTTSQHCLNAICPECQCINSEVIDSSVLQASSIQSFNIPKNYFK